ncbi:MAG: hypothetical protein MUQ30_18325 [Anaerolineae bacterium]|nr:hypothetical protein [Anaerolineae bacterium]
MANLPIIIPGLAIPDPNFIWPVDETSDASWEILGGMTAAQYVQRGDNTYKDTMPTTGRVLDVHTVGAAGGITDGLLSGPTPTGIMCGGGVIISHYLWVGCIVKTAGVAAGNTNDLVTLRVEQFTSTGAAVGTPVNMPFTSEPGRLREPVADYTLYWQSASVVLTDTTSYFKLRMYFNIDSNGGAADTISIPFVGCGYSANNNPQLNTSWYTADVSTSSNNMRRQVSSRGRMNPHIFVQDQGAHAQSVNVTFPMLTEADRAKIMHAWYWNSGTPTADLDNTAYAALNRGSSQPVLVALDRDNIKKAFYADFASPPVFTQATPGWWPDASPVWSTSLTFTERLF